MNDFEEYKVYYFIDSKSNTPVKEYIDGLSEKEQTKIFAYMELLKDRKGYLDEPYSKHIIAKIRELRVDFAKRRHRIFYFTFIGKKIILLHAFLKKTEKTPEREINKALENYKSILLNRRKYE